MRIETNCLVVEFDHTLVSAYETAQPVSVRINLCDVGPNARIAAVADTIDHFSFGATLHANHVERMHMPPKQRTSCTRKGKI